MRSKGSRTKKIRIRMEINKTETRNTIEKNNEIKTGSLRKSVTLMKLARLIRGKKVGRHK